MPKTGTAIDGGWSWLPGAAPQSADESTACCCGVHERERPESLCRCVTCTALATELGWFKAAINKLTNPALDPPAKIPEFRYCAVWAVAGGKVAG